MRILAAPLIVACRLGAGSRPVSPALFTLDGTVGHERIWRVGPGRQQGPQVVVVGRTDLAGT